MNGTTKMTVLLQEPLERLGSLRMSQTGSPAFRFDLSAPGSYSATVLAGDCVSPGAPVFTLASITPAVSTPIPVANLSNIVDGAHILRLKRAGETILCESLGNLVNGSLSTVIDVAKLAGYQISVGENADGTLSALVPLSLATDPVSGKTEAFNGRMFYQHSSGATISHTVNLVWLVTVLTDACPDADCGRPDAVIDQQRVVHQYRDESWVVSGLLVTEDQGVDVAIVYEDPAAESDSAAEREAHLVEWDDNLWHLANGLQRIFVEGVDCDAGTGLACAGVTDAQRDLRVADIKTRWDSGVASTNTQRWGIAADAFNVVTASFAHPGEMGGLSESVIPSLLNQAFGNGIFPFSSTLGLSTTQVFPTFLIANEQRYRAVGSDSVENVGISGRVLTVNFDPGPATSKIEPVTAAALSWKPFRRGAGGWEPMPLTDYWDRMEKMLPLSPSYSASGDRESAYAAAAVVSVLLAALATTGIGAIIVAILGLIDSVISLFCGLFPPADDNAAAQWTCKGLSGILAEGVAYVIYDATDIIDLNNPHRLRFARFNPYLADASSGFVSGASLKMNLSLENTIKTESFDSPLGFLYGWQFNEGNTRDATFTYAVVNAAEKDPKNQIHNRVKPGANPGAWVALGNKQYRQTWTITQTQSPLTLPAPGLNAPLSAYLAEGYASPTQECIVIPNIIPPWTPPVIPICYVRARSASNYLDLNLDFDVFPTTLSGFYSLTPQGGGYALSWGQTGKTRFPWLNDADGDGLSYSVDPNDSNIDTDGDGVTDLREIQIGSWTHVGVAVEAVGAQTVARFFVNSAQTEAVTRTMTALTAAPNDEVLIGAGTPIQSTALDEPWIGYIDELVMFSRPLNAAGMVNAYFNMYNLTDATLTDGRLLSTRWSSKASC